MVPLLSLGFCGREPVPLQYKMRSRDDARVSLALEKSTPH